MAKRLLMGNEAFAHAALEAGVGVVAGYPGTPSSELIETVARQRAKGRAEGVHVEWSDNEKAALEICAAASMSGVRALFTCKQVGMNVASDALMSFNYVGVRGGLVLFVADDPGPISSQTEQDTRTFAQFAHVPVLDPATPEQGYLMMKKAFELSELYRTPVIVRPTTRINHASTFFDVDEYTRALPPRADVEGPAGLISDGSDGFVRDPQRWVIFPPRAFEGHGEINDRLKKIAHTYSYDGSFAQFNPVYVNGRRVGSGMGADRNNPRAKKAASTTPEEVPANVTVGIVAGGDTAAYALEALGIIRREARRSGMKVPDCKFMQIGTPYPFPRRTAVRFFKDISDVLVLEELDPFIESELLKVAGTSFLAPSIHGKLTGEASARGENSTEDVARRIALFFDKYAKPESSDVDDTIGVAGASVSGRIPMEDAPAASDSHAVTDATRMHAYDDMDDDYDSFDDDLSDAAPAPASRESNIAMRLAALQKQMTFAELVDGVLGPDALYRYDKELPVRAPVLCAGCPHRSSFYAVKRALATLDIPRSEAIFCGDIGCYTLGNADPLDAVDTCLCMGAGITMAQGFAVTNPNKKCIAFVGDSTLFASGMTGIANAVYNDHDITIVVLDNSTTAMTGMQPHPGTGITLMGGRSYPIDIEYALLALGVEAVYTADPLDRAAAEDACVKALQTEGPTAVILQSPCIWLTRDEHVAIVNAYKCTGCKKCITEIGCPAITFDLDARGPKSARRGQSAIDASQCNGCGLCAQVCPFQAIQVYSHDELRMMNAVQSQVPASSTSPTTDTEREVDASEGGDVDDQQVVAGVKQPEVADDPRENALPVTESANAIDSMGEAETTEVAPAVDATPAEAFASSSPAMHDNPPQTQDARLSQTRMPTHVPTVSLDFSSMQSEEGSRGKAIAYDSTSFMPAYQQETETSEDPEASLETSQASDSRSVHSAASADQSASQVDKVKKPVESDDDPIAKQEVSFDSLLDGLGVRVDANGGDDQ